MRVVEFGAVAQKSLGQELYEADPALDESWPWQMLGERERSDYEQLASRLATVVRERCAQAGASVCFTDKQAELVCDAIRRIVV